MDVHIKAPNVRDKLMDTLSFLPMKHSCEVVHWNGSKPGTFREQVSVRLPGGNSFWVGMALNGVTTNWGHCRIEFNPNKVATNEVFQEILLFLIENSRTPLRQVKRFDLAVDIPVERQRCFLVKDRRMYIERRHGQEYTQYLGAKSSTVGRVKLYNKSIESCLEHPLTRLELTLNPETTYADIPWPTVYYIDTLDACFDGVKITDTERFILTALLDGHGSLTDLGRKTRSKMELLMEKYLRSVDIAAEDYETILRQLQTYVDGTALTIRSKASAE